MELHLVFTAHPSNSVGSKFTRPWFVEYLDNVDPPHRFSPSCAYSHCRLCDISNPSSAPFREPLDGVSRGRRRNPSSTPTSRTSPVSKKTLGPRRTSAFRPPNYTNARLSRLLDNLCGIPSDRDDPYAAQIQIQTPRCFREPQRASGAAGIAISQDSGIVTGSSGLYAGNPSPTFVITSRC